MTQVNIYQNLCMHTEFGKNADLLEKIQQAKSKTNLFIIYALSTRKRDKFQKAIINVTKINGEDKWR